MRMAPSSAITGLMVIGFSTSVLLLFPLDSASGADAEAWRVWTLGVLWFLIVFAGVRSGVSRRAAIGLTVCVGSLWYAVLGVIQDDGSGLWTAGLVAFGIPALIAVSFTAAWLAERPPLAERSEGR